MISLTLKSCESYDLILIRAIFLSDRHFHAVGVCVLRYE